MASFGYSNGIYDAMEEQSYFVNTAPPVVASSGLVGGPVASLSQALGNNATSLLLVGLIVGMVAYSYWVRSIDR